MREMKDASSLHVSGVELSLLALLAANEPLVWAVTEWKVSEAKTANMLK